MNEIDKKVNKRAEQYSRQMWPLLSEQEESSFIKENYYPRDLRLNSKCDFINGALFATVENIKDVKKLKQVLIEVNDYLKLNDKFLIGNDMHGDDKFTSEFKQIKFKVEAVLND